MTVAERTTRSRLAQLIDQRGLLRGTLLLRRRVCGKRRCRCTQGCPHESLYLVISEGGRKRQVCIPKAWRERVRRWVEDYHRVQDLLEEVSAIGLDRLRQRRD